MNRFILYIGGPEDTREKSFKTFRIGSEKKATFSYGGVEGREKKCSTHPAPTSIRFPFYCKSRPQQKHTNKGLKNPFHHGRFYESIHKHVLSIIKIISVFQLVIVLSFLSTLTKIHFLNRIFLLNL